MNVLRGHSADTGCVATGSSNNKSLRSLARPARFELTTSAFGGQRSIQLSYGRGKDVISRSRRLRQRRRLLTNKAMPGRRKIGASQ